MLAALSGQVDAFFQQQRINPLKNSLGCLHAGGFADSSAGNLGGGTAGDKNAAWGQFCRRQQFRSGLPRLRLNFFQILHIPPSFRHYWTSIVPKR